MVFNRLDVADFNVLSIPAYLTNRNARLGKYPAGVLSYLGMGLIGTTFFHFSVCPAANSTSISDESHKFPKEIVYKEVTVRFELTDE